jgi:hypothetical protein
MIDRTIEPVFKNLVTKYPVVTITGPRQSGKTTLCRKVFPELPYENLEIPDVRQYALDDPRGFLNRYSNGVILDEIQRAPHLLSYIQGIVDEKQITGQFILTGSQQFEVLNKVSQSLAGRTALLKLLPFSLAEIQVENTPASVDRLILSGFYPRIHDQHLNPTQALGDYMATYVERDVRQLAAIKDLSLFEKFVKLCAGRVGQILNLQSLANDVGVSHTTARSWISILEAGFIIFLLPPWFGNISKRLIKSPKLYFCDVGLASYLLGQENELHVSRDPLRGHLFENIAVIEAMKYRFNRGLRSNLSFYRDSGGNEVDLIMEIGPDIFPVEIKAAETVTPGSLKGLKKFAGEMPELRWGSGLLYGGGDVQVRSDVRIYPLTKIHEMLAALA